ncbi:hypothetical protein [Marinicauda salina]|nr:hypothetical protein [Marinicauda salina]
MTVKLDREDARQGEKREFQQRIFLLSTIGAAAALGLALIVILGLRPF